MTSSSHGVLQLPRTLYTLFLSYSSYFILPNFVVHSIYIACGIVFPPQYWFEVCLRQGQPLPNGWSLLSRRTSITQWMAMDGLKSVITCVRPWIPIVIRLPLGPPLYLLYARYSHIFLMHEEKKLPFPASRVPRIKDYWWNKNIDYNMHRHWLYQVICRPLWYLPTLSVSYIFCNWIKQCSNYRLLHKF